MTDPLARVTPPAEAVADGVRLSGEDVGGAGPAADAVGSLESLLDHLEELLAVAEGLPEQQQNVVFELLDGVDALHRVAVTRLAQLLDPAIVAAARQDPAVDWLLEAYGVGVNDLGAADAALEQVRPYLHEHGGEVRVLGVSGGVVRVQLEGACSGCTSAAATLRHGVEEALRENLPGFASMDVATDVGAAAHPPPAQVLLQITARPR